MSLFGVGGTAQTALAKMGIGDGQPAQTVQIANGSIIPGQSAVPGAYMAQPASGGGFGSILKKALVGGVAGGAMGAGYGVLAGFVSFLPHVTIPLGAAIGAAAGAALGLIKGVRDNMKAKKLGLQAQQQAMLSQIQPGAGVNPAAIQRARPKGRTLRAGAKGSEIKYTQRALRRLGLYRGKITATLDKQTLAAIRRYEVMKGAMPTGLCSPELRKALAQDAHAARQFGM